MTKVILNRIFEYGGTVGCPNDKGNYKGIYLIVLPEGFQQVVFEANSNAYWFKGKDPTIPIDVLQNKWVHDSNILYIGKHEKSVRKRMQQHIDFWAGNRAAAWGGRIIAQIQNYDKLEIWYLPCDNPKGMEHNLLIEFKKGHENLPFANYRT